MGVFVYLALGILELVAVSGVCGALLFARFPPPYRTTTTASRTFIRRGFRLMATGCACEAVGVLCMLVTGLRYLAGQTGATVPTRLPGSFIDHLVSFVGVVAIVIGFGFFLFAGLTLRSYARRER